MWPPTLWWISFFIFIGKVWKTRRRTDEQWSYCPTDHWAFSKECYFSTSFYILSPLLSECVCQLNHRNSWGQIIRTIASFDTLTAANHLLCLYTYLKFDNHNSYTECYHGGFFQVSISLIRWAVCISSTLSMLNEYAIAFLCNN